MAQKYWHIRNCSLFGRLSDEQLEMLEQHAQIKKFPKSCSIYLPSDRADGAFLVGEGRVRLCSTTPDGKQSILAFIEPGEIFGELSIIDNGLREERAETTIGSTIIWIPGQILRTIMDESPNLILGVTKLIGMRRKRIERRLRSLLFRNNRERLTHLLSELTDQYGNATTEGIELTIRLSHQDMASVIGATRETVTTLLGEMQAEGLVKIRRQRLVVLDKPRLLAGLNKPTEDNSAAGSSPSAFSQQPSTDKPFENMHRRVVSFNS